MKRFIIIIILLNTIFQSTIYAQLNNKVLVLTKINDRKKIIKQGKKIKVWINENGISKKYSGRLSVINQSTIKVDNKVIEITKITKLKGPNLRNEITGSILL